MRPDGAGFVRPTTPWACMHSVKARISWRAWAVLGWSLPWPGAVAVEGELEPQAATRMEHAAAAIRAGRTL